MIELVSIIAIVFGVLQIVLFFKIWGMTNDTKMILNMVNLRNRLTFLNNLPPKCKNFRGDIYYVKGINEDKVLCVREENDEDIKVIPIDEVSFIED